MSVFRKPGRLLSGMTAAALSASLLLHPATASANDIVIDLNSVSSALGGIDTDSDHSSVGDTLSDIARVASAVNINGTDAEELLPANVIADPRVAGIKDIGKEASALEEHLQNLDKLLNFNSDRGQTDDGRAVVFPTKGEFTSGFGSRWGRTHQGIDIANREGTAIRAVMDGKVVASGPASGFGNWIVIEHDGGEKSVYGHMRVLNVSVGERVTAGQKIAEIGNEGYSTGPHLHFEIHPDGKTAVDPVTWFAQQGISVTLARQ